MSDLESANDILATVRPLLRGVFITYRIPREDREDILQDALLAAWRCWGVIENPRLWLLGTLRRMCVGYWRRKRALRVDAVAPDKLAELAAPQPGAQEGRVVAADLHRLLMTLPARHRRVLVYRYGLGLSVAEVAAVLGCRPASVRKTAGRAAARVQHAYAPAAVAPTSHAPPSP